MTFDRFTEHAKRTIAGAEVLACQRGHDCVETIHLLAALADYEEFASGAVLSSLGLTREKAGVVFAETTEDGPPLRPVRERPLAPNAKKVCELALRESLSLGCNYIGTEHLLLGLARLADLGFDRGALEAVGLEAAGLREAILVHLATLTPRRFNPESGRIETVA